MNYHEPTIYLIGNTVAQRSSICLGYGILNWVSISQLEDDLKTLTEKFNTLNGYFSFTSGLSGIAFHAWDGGFQIATKGDAQQKIATFDKNGINFYLDGNYTWHK